jgi:ferredoxin--NADP+ reductase
METLYHNDRNADLALYYDQATFKAFESLSKRPWLDESNAIEQALQKHAQDIWQLIQKDDTSVYLAGLEHVSAMLDNTMAKTAGSSSRWRWLRQDLQEQGRWFELLYT